MPSSGAETHLFSSHPAIDASEASASRAWGPCRPISPKDSIKASHETRNRPEECRGSTVAGRPRALFVTKRHKTSRFGNIQRYCLLVSFVRPLPDLEAPASRGGEAVSGRHLRLSGAGLKPPAAPSLKTIFVAPSAFGCFFGIRILRHLRRPRAARGVKSRHVGLRDGRAVSGCAARPRRRARTRNDFGFFGFGYFHFASAGVADGATD